MVSENLPMVMRAIWFWPVVAVLGAVLVLLITPIVLTIVLMIVAAFQTWPYGALVFGVGAAIFAIPLVVVVLIFRGTLWSRGS